MCDAAHHIIDFYRRHAEVWAARRGQTLFECVWLDLGRRFQGVLAWNSFFHLMPEHQREMFGVFARHADPGAALMFTSGTGHGARIGELHGDPLYHASLDPKEYRDVLDAHGFDLVGRVVEDPDCNQHTVWLAVRRDD